MKFLRVLEELTNKDKSEAAFVNIDRIDSFSVIGEPLADGLCDYFVVANVGEYRYVLGVGEYEHLDFETALGYLTELVKAINE